VLTCGSNYPDGCLSVDGVGFVNKNGYNTIKCNFVGCDAKTCCDSLTPPAPPGREKCSSVAELCKKKDMAPIAHGDLECRAASEGGCTLFDCCDGVALGVKSTHMAVGVLLGVLLMMLIGGGSYYAVRHFGGAAARKNVSPQAFLSGGR
jgi:hypothetical protein